MPFFGGSPPGPPPSAQLYHYVGTNILGGTNALNVSTGQNNIALGTGAQQDLLNGDLNVVIGLNAGQSPGGPNPTTTQHSIAIGNTVGFTDGVSDSVVIGTFAFAQSNSSVVIGAHSVSGVGADFSVTLGYNSIAEIHGVAIGNVAQQAGDGDVTIGNGAHDSAGANSIGIGTLAGGTGISHIGIGNNARGFDDYAIGIGDHAKADATGSISIGHNSYVPGAADGPDIPAPSGIAIGAGSSSKNTTSGEGYGVAVGGFAFSDNDGVAVGGGAHANDSSIAVGASASNDTFVDAIIIGANLVNTANNQIIIGDNTYTDITIGGHAFPGAGGGTTDLTAPATGFTYTVPNGTASALINPAGTLATGTINMPAVPTDGQKLTSASSQQITALTMSGNGKTLLGALVTIGANGFATWQYRASITTWFRVG